MNFSALIITQFSWPKITSVIQNEALKQESRKMALFEQSWRNLSKNVRSREIKRIVLPDSDIRVITGHALRSAFAAMTHAIRCRFPIWPNEIIAVKKAKSRRPAERSGSAMMARFEFEPGTARIICERPYYDRRAVVTALGLG